MVDRVVEEEDLRGLYEDRNQRKESCVDENINTTLQEDQNGCHERSDQVESDDGKDHTQDTDGEVVDQHLETGRDFSFNCGIELLDHPTAKGACKHCAHQHRIIRCAADNAYACDCAHDRASCAANHLTACISDQNRKHVGQHRADHCGKLFIGQPTSCDEKCCDKSPGDERADVRHNHTA